MESAWPYVPKRGMSHVQERVCPKCSCRSYYDMRPMTAWCWQSGLIEIGEADQELPDGAIQIASGPKVELKLVLDVLARHGYGSAAGKLIVPGIPEADEAAKIDALETWLAWCGKNKRFEKNGVIFETGKA